MNEALKMSEPLIHTHGTQTERQIARLTAVQYCTVRYSAFHLTCGHHHKPTKTLRGFPFFRPVCIGSVVQHIAHVSFEMFQDGFHFNETVFFSNKLQ